MALAACNAGLDDVEPRKGATAGTGGSSSTGAGGTGRTVATSGSSVGGATQSGGTSNTGGTNDVDGAVPPLVDAGVPDFGGPFPDASLCAGPAPVRTFAVSSGTDVRVPGAFVVLSGTLPPDINGSPVTAVEVGGSARGVRFDAARGVWSYLLAASVSGSLSVTARAASGATAGPLAVRVTLAGSPTAPARDFVAGQRMVGSWMFTWFTGDTSWRCGSAWQPPGGFASWNGSAAWARDQLVDQIDAHLDAIGLQLDTPTGTGTQGYRFNNVVHVMEAARGLLEEGVLPPRLFPFIDTAIIANHWTQAQGSTLNLATASGRTFLYGHPQAYYRAAATALGPVFATAGAARFDGRPAVGLWHSVTMNGEDDAAVLDLKARFRADFGSNPYFVAHPNDWRNFPAVDEITLMVGPPMHYFMGGRDASGAPTINVEAGFWNPTSNTFYLPRVGGSNYAAACDERAGAEGHGAARLGRYVERDRRRLWDFRRPAHELRVGRHRTLWAIREPARRIVGHRRASIHQRHARASDGVERRARPRCAAHRRGRARDDAYGREALRDRRHAERRRSELAGQWPGQWPRADALAGVARRGILRRARRRGRRRAVRPARRSRSRPTRRLHRARDGALHIGHAHVVAADDQSGRGTFWQTLHGRRRHDGAMKAA